MSGMGHRQIFDINVPQILAQILISVSHFLSQSFPPTEVTLDFCVNSPVSHVGISLIYLFPMVNISLNQIILLISWGFWTIKIEPPSIQQNVSHPPCTIDINCPKKFPAI